MYETMGNCYIPHFGVTYLMEVKAVSFSDRLKVARRKKGMSQSELGKMVEVSLNTLSRWEQGERIPRGDELAALSDVLGVSTDYLIKGVEPVGDISNVGGVVVAQNENTTVGDITNEAPPSAPVAVPPALVGFVDERGYPTDAYWGSVLALVKRLRDDPSYVLNRHPSDIQDALYNLYRSEIVIRELMAAANISVPPEMLHKHLVHE